MTNCYFPNTKSLIDYIQFESISSEGNILKKIQKTALNSLYFVAALFPLLCSLSLDCFQLVGRLLHKTEPPAPAPQAPPPAILEPLPDPEEINEMGMVMPEIEEPAPNPDSFLQRHWKKTALTTALFLSASIYFTYQRFYE